MMELLGLRHRPSGVFAAPPDRNQPFADYVRRTRAMLEHLHEGKSEQEKIVAGNCPFEALPPPGSHAGRNKPWRRGVLLTHGLIDSPYHMRHLAAFFQRNGFRVLALLLPGHGTQPGDLLDVRWQAWADTVAYGVDCLADEVDELYLAGFSAGAALSVLQASRDTRVRGLFLFSPALEITPLAKWANLHKLYSWLLPRAAWVNILQDRDLYKYESFCKNAAAQMYALTRVLPHGATDIPVFAVASADDATVNSAATLRFMQRAHHPASRLVWYATPNQAGVRETALPEQAEWVDSTVPEKRILSSAHTAIVIPPQDEYYGEAGAYANCLHYLPHDTQRYTACRARSAEVYFGEVNNENLQRGLLRRLTYNPHYAAMEASMQEFIGRLT